MTKRFLAVISITLLLSGCSKITSYSKDTFLMDTFVHIEIRDKLTWAGRKWAAARAIRRMKELEDSFNYFQSGSEIAKINRLKINEKFVLTNEMFKVLNFSRKIRRKTGGAFNITATPFKISENGWVLDKTKKTIRLKKKGIKINLGGVAKGFIVDQGIRALKKSGVRNALINAGGDMYCMGDGSDQGGWKVGIRDPQDSRKVIGTFRVRDKGVATSGSYERSSHIIDPRTGYPVEKILKSVTVIAKNCRTADALATALYVLGPREGLSVIENILRAECVIVDEKGETYISKGFPQINLTNPKR